MGLSYLGDLLEQLRQESLLGLAEARTGRGAPCISYVSVGAPAIASCCSCGETDGGGGLLTTHLGGGGDLFDSADFTQPDEKCRVKVKPLLTVTFARCSPTLTAAGAAPSATDLSASAARLYGDLWSLLTYLLGRRNSPSFLSSTIPCGEIKIVSVRDLDGGPESGCAGFEVTLQVTMNDSGP